MVPNTLDMRDTAIGESLGAGGKKLLSSKDCDFWIGFKRDGVRSPAG